MATYQANVMDDQMPVDLDWDSNIFIKAGVSDEPLVMVKNSAYWFVRPAYYEASLANALPNIWVREGVYNRLIIASENLSAQYRLVLLDGWRPKVLQKQLFYNMRDAIKREHPFDDDSEITRKTLLYASKASEDPIRPSPHLTGGSIDVTLADEHGVLLDMGSDFDEATERSWTTSSVPPECAERRVHLLKAMKSAGFTNLPSEWWHYDYGNWVWAFFSNQSEAIYGPTQLP